MGPPPGALQLVRHHIPVVFFTRRGIPGEVDEGMDSLSGAMAACMRALKASGNLRMLHSRVPVVLGWGDGELAPAAAYARDSVIKAFHS